MNDSRIDTDLADGFGQRWVEGLLAAFLGRAGDDAGGAGSAQRLGDLDRRSGDGDFGTNIAAALRRARTGIESEPPTDYAGWITAVSRGFLGTGGTSGPLFGMFFRELARCSGGGEPTLGEFAAGLAAGLASVQKYGNAQVGHKTMVDAIAPAVDVLSGLTGPADPTDALATAAQAAVAGARDTADLLARRGRASYVGEVARGVLDPGAAAVAIVLQAAAAAQEGTTATIDTGWVDA